MASRLFVSEEVQGGLRVCGGEVTLRTDARHRLVDLSEVVRERVRRSGVRTGLVCIQTRHTTTGILVNENEPLLLQDIERTLERLAPRDLVYAHDDLARRPDVPADETRNGEAHCKAMLLQASACLTVMHGQVQLGRWQSLFLAELDGPRTRTVSIVVMGAPGELARGSS